jgi:hypothetical protein
MTRAIWSVFVGTLLLAGSLGCDSRSPTGPTTVTPPGPTITPGPTNTNGIAIAGHVYDRAWRRLVSARIEVLDGPNAGLSTTSDAQGGFRLAGAFDETTRFRASLAGHRDQILVLPARCPQCNPNWWIYFSLDRETPAANLLGEYTLTFTADASCAAIPVEFRTRSFDVSVRPSRGGVAAQFVVAVESGNLLAGYDAFDAGVAGDYFAGMLGDFHGSPGLAERVADDTFLGFEGTASAVLPADTGTVVGSFDGVISLCKVAGAPGSRYSCDSATARAMCTSSRHQFTLRRRAAGSSSY